ncbi:hypothetical protein N0V93_009973 [Gnomoniopsis smithogilvyi]|uniref:Heterokaryon incompatibility domain-containing protein n=1 Tax=Gnomoniopsis smithogilvyi TaxID=1191159 RepID=A0A9W8YJF3_9PEZI|nr:hypothetical protein N0V93_009973 [Gnomoniopsis smithogilvyi]
MKIQLPDDWSWEQPKAYSSWCETCGWNGSWADLLRRSNLKNVSRCCPLLNESSLRTSASANVCCALLLALYRKYLPSRQSGYITINFDDELLVYDERRQRLPSGGRLNIHSTCSSHPETVSLATVSTASAEPCRMVGTGSAKALAWAKNHIDICSESHTCHEFRSKDTTLPTRLIEIPRDPDNGTIRLRNSSDLRQDIKYVALSYCWGTKMSPCLTTSGNLAQHMNNIGWPSIPQTFRDAVLFTRSLGVEYLWIDSICIIQGDDAIAKADWSREAAQMYKYYSNAYVTLAAASSSDCHGGLFNKDPIEEFHLLDFTFRGHDYSLFASENPSDALDFADAAAGLGWDVENRYPLLSRAWAFQERLVSPRVIFFTKTQLIWDCYAGCAFEEDAARDKEHGQLLQQGIKQGYRKLLQQPNLSWKDSNCAFEWNHVLKAYSHLQLSDARDRLPAFAAIAEQILSRNYDDPAAEYLCGLRKGDLHTDLQWMPAGDSMKKPTCVSKRKEPYVAPSWSWASFPGRIMDNAHYESCRLSTIHLVQDSLIFHESRRLSRVLGGHIVIEGPLVECTWDVSNAASGPQLEERPQILRVLSQSPASSQCATEIEQLDKKQQHSIEFIPDYADAYDEIEDTVCLGQISVCLLQTWKDAVQGRSGALVLLYNKTTGRCTRLGARVRERPRSDETPPWGLVDTRIFGSAKSQILELE